MTYDPDTSTPDKPRKHRGRGIGTVIACFAAAVVIAAIIDDDHKPHKPAVSIAIAADESAAPSINDGRTVYKINKGHVVVVSTTGPAKVEMDPDLKAKAEVVTTGNRTTIKIDDSFSDDSEIRILVPHAEKCRIELAAGLLNVEGLPCTDNDLIVRSGKMDVSDVPAVHGKLSGEVRVGMVVIDGGDGPAHKSSGVGDLRAEVPGTGAGPALTARVDVGMLTVDVD